MTSYPLKTFNMDSWIDNAYSSLNCLMTFCEIHEIEAPVPTKASCGCPLIPICTIFLSSFALWLMEVTTLGKFWNLEAGLLDEVALGFCLCLYTSCLSLAPGYCLPDIHANSYLDDMQTLVKWPFDICGTEHFYEHKLRENGLTYHRTCISHPACGSWVLGLPWNLIVDNMEFAFHIVPVPNI